MTRRELQRLAIMMDHPWCVKPLRLYAGVEYGARVECDLSSSKAPSAAQLQKKNGATTTTDSAASETL